MPAIIICLGLLLVACGGSSSKAAATAVVATPSSSASPEPTLVLGTCATLLPLGERPAPASLRDVRVPDDREGVRQLFDHIPREIDGRRLLPFVGPPEIFAARYGDDATLVLSAKQFAQNETGQSAIERDVAASSARCESGRDGVLVWAILTGPGHVVIRWARIDRGWSFGAVAPDMARADMLVASYRDAMGSGTATTPTEVGCSRLN